VALSLFFVGVAKLNFARIDQSFIALRQASQLVYSDPSRGTDSCVRAAIATKRSGGGGGGELLPRSAHKIYKLLGGLWNSLFKVSAYGILFDQKPAYGIPLPLNKSLFR
jgi:hypothetical protein